MSTPTNHAPRSLRASTRRLFGAALLPFLALLGFAETVGAQTPTAADQFEIADGYEIYEGETITLIMSPASTHQHGLACTGTATKGTDYKILLASGSQHACNATMWSDGTALASNTAYPIKLQVLADSSVEADETIVLEYAHGYGDFATGSITVTIKDGARSTQSSDGVTVSESTLALTEGHATDNSKTYTVKLDSDPGADVEIAVASDDTDAAEVSPETLTFTSSNWSEAQTVTVTAVEDGDIANESVTVSHTASVAGDSSNVYDGVTIADVTANVTDAGHGVIVSESSLSVDESGDGNTGTYTLRLKSAPGGTVTVTPTSSMTANATVSPSSLDFDDSDWSDPQTVTVTGVGDGSSTISHAVTTATTDYPVSLSIPSVAVTVDAVAAGLPTVEVPADWAFVPAGVGAGGKFRLMFQTAHATTAASADIDTYNTFVQNRANMSSDATIAANSAHFRAVGSTAAVDARDNTETNPTDDGPGESIYWLGGAKLADDYADLYDGDWDSGGGDDARNKDGTDENVSGNTLTWTGSDDDGTASANPLGAVTVSCTWKMQVDGLNRDSGQGCPGGNGAARRMFALSPVFQVAAAVSSGGVTVAPQSLALTEGHATDFEKSYTVVLDSDPGADVQIAVASDDTGAATVSPSSLTFTSSDWSVPQPVTVTAVEDGDVAAESVTVSHTASVAGDSTNPYDGITISDVTAAVADAGHGVIVSESSLSVDESGDGNTGTYTIRLKSQPGGTVTITATSSMTANATVAPSTLDFDNSNWDSPQTVTVTGVDDGSSTVSHAVTTGTADYPTTTTVASVDVTVDAAAALPVITIVRDAASVAEGTAVSFTVSASPVPAAALTVSVSVTQSGSFIDGTAPVSVVVPTSGSATLSVATDDDSADEADGSVTATVTSGTGYTVGSPFAATVAVTDDDVPQVTIVRDAASVAEGTAAEFTVTASPVPHSALTVSVSVTQSGSYIDGTAPVSVTVPTSGSATLSVATDDDSADEANGSVTATVTSGTGYTVGSPLAATVAVTDDDVPQVTIVRDAASVAEGTAAEFTVSASPVPHSALTVSVSVAQTGSYIDGTAPVSVTVPTSGSATLSVATDDDSADEADGSVTATVTAGSGYAVDSPSTATIAVTDDDATSVTLDATGAAIAEDGGTKEVTVELERALAAGEELPVTLTFGGAAAAGTDYTLGCAAGTGVGCAGTGGVRTVTFTSGGQAATVTVTAVDDDFDEGAGESVTVTMGALGATSGTNLSGGASGAGSPKSFSITDDDTAGVTVSQSMVSVVENAGTATYTVVLDSRPTANVTVTVASAAASAATVSPSPVTFTSSNWSTARTVTVTGVNDNVDNTAARTSAITHTAASSDSDYSGIAVDGVTATVTDDDPTTVTLTATTAAIAENGTKTVTLMLGRALVAGEVLPVGLTMGGTTTPVDDWTLACPAATWLACTDLGTATPTLTLTGPTAASVALTLTAVDDDIDEGALETVTVALDALTSSSGTGLAGGAASSGGPFGFDVTDDDTAGVTFAQTGGSTAVTEAAGGRTDTYDVVLDSEPTGLVAIAVTGDGMSVQLNDPEGVPADGTVLLFTAENWDQPQTVTVTAVDDALYQGAVRTVTVGHSISTADARYGALVSLASISVTVADDEAVPHVAFTAVSPASVTEGAAITFTLSVTPAAAAALEVTVNVLDAPGAGNDFLDAAEEGTRTVTVPAAAATHAFTVDTASDDDVDVPDDYVTATLVAGTGYTVPSSGVGLARIAEVRDDDAVANIAVKLTVSGTSLAEGGSVTVTATLASANLTGAPIVVPIEVESGTVEAGDWGLPASITIANNATSGTATFTAVDDSVDEPTETATVALAASLPAGLSRGAPDKHTLTVADNDPTQVTLAGSNDAIAETAGTKTVTVTLGRALAAGESLPVTVTFGGTATAGADYTVACAGADCTGTGATRTVTFTAGDQTATVTITAEHDTTDEGTAETVSVTLGALGGTSGTNLDGGATGSGGPVTFVIADDDDPVVPVVTITRLGAATVTEGAAVQFRLTATPAPTADITVSVTVADAAAGSDFLLPAQQGSRNVVIAAGTATKSFTVTTHGDSADEPDGDITATVNAGTGYSLGAVATRSAAATVEDDDGPPPVTVTISRVGPAAIVEGAQARYRLTASPAPASAVTVNVTVADAAGSDFLLPAAEGSRPVVIAAGATTQDFTVDTRNDSTDEPDGDIRATVSAGAGYTAGSPSTVATRVNDNDLPPRPTVTVTAGDAVTEGTAVRFTVHASFAPASGLPVSVTVAETGGGEYVLAADERTRTVVIAAGATSRAFAVATQPDSVEEPAGRVRATVNARPQYLLGSPRVAGVDVFDDDAPTLVTVAAVVGDPVIEGGPARFTLHVAPPPPSPLTVNVNIADAGNGKVLTGANTGMRQVTVPADAATHGFEVATDDDYQREPHGLVRATVTAGGGYQPGDAAAASAPVWNNDRGGSPQLLVSPRHVSVTERGGPAQYLVGLNTRPDGDVTVRLYPQGGRGSASVEPQTLTFTPESWRTPQAVTVTALPDDNTWDERVTVWHSVWGYGRVTRGPSATIRVTDDGRGPRPRALFPQATSTVHETAGTHSVLISLWPAPTQPLTLHYTLSGDAAPGDDYAIDGATGTRGTVEVRPGQQHLLLAVSVVDDDDHESAETLTVTLEPAADHEYAVADAHKTHTVTIVSDDPPPAQPRVSFRIARSETAENAGTHRVRVDVSPAPSEPLTVRYDIAGGTAAAGSDYTIAGLNNNRGTVRIPANQTHAYIELTVADDSADELDETARLRLLGGSGYELGRSAARLHTVTVRDDDGPVPAARFALAASVQPEVGGATRSVRIDLSPAPTQPVTLRYTVAGTAVDNGDYRILGTRGSVGVPAGQDRAHIRVETLHDTADDGDRTLVLTLTAAPGYTLAAPSAHTMTLADDDVPQVTVTSLRSVQEGQNAAFRLTAAPPPGNPITVKVTIAEVGGGDFLRPAHETTRHITVAGRTTTFTVPTHDDNAYEPDGAIQATVDPGSGYQPASGSTAIAAVADDDARPQPTVTVTGGSAVTEGRPAQFTLRAHPAPQFDLTVTVDIADAPGSDFVAGPDQGPRTVVIPAGATAKAFAVATDNDGRDEPDGDITAAVTAGRGYQPGHPATAAVRVRDNDRPPPPPEGPTVTIRREAASVSEGHTARFTLTATPPPAHTLVVAVNVTTAQGSFRTIPANGIKHALITSDGTGTLLVRIADDDTDEDDGRLRAAIQPGNGYQLGTPSTADIAVHDNDNAPPPPADAGVTVTAQEATITEGHTAVFWIRAEPAPDPHTVRVFWHLQKHGNMFYGPERSTRSSAAIPPDGVIKIEIPTWNDFRPEPHSTITLTLTRTTGAQLGDTTTATITIQDND